MTDSRIGTVWQEYFIDWRIPEAKKEGLHLVHLVEIRVDLDHTERDIEGVVSDRPQPGASV